MTWETLISVAQLQHLLAAGSDILLIDCEFELGAPDKGPSLYARGHLPGARYAHLDNDLAGPPDGTNGRHPLPARVALAAWLRSLGLRKGQQVVVYDSHGGAWAARAWWLLRWMGHAQVAVLDGGKPAWIAAGLPLDTTEPGPTPTGDFEAGDPLVGAPVNAAAVLKNIEGREAQVLDARDPSRFRGDPNPIDPVSGHIPGARNRFFRDNLGPDGLFRPASELAADFHALLGGKPAVLSCGSGVTACHNALAMEIAGMPGARLYPGSWSEWISNPARPVETGET
ncbi:sulfurtransferase [Novosphingobium mangrovi (ex Huang et al. 2023)]|uniref:Sulfurtransferase n=1 Tax=Novosphingobium mangrovi (ex Huang et al. 2023) TaxID=2976432 RepID=A0ABT2I2T2_9SPHN|nr:sulfurtransferase [Novosphingobium mangrovi (ex Huang et al. 2023)]MCT2399106.1 sulfurtransferase [Novosphingobium mangrovi (ex Huang et al. 2023)]